VWLAYLFIATGMTNLGLALVLAVRGASGILSPWLWVFLGTLHLSVAGVLLRRERRRRRALALQRALDAAFLEPPAPAAIAKAHEP